MFFFNTLINKLFTERFQQRMSSVVLQCPVSHPDLLEVLCRWITHSFSSCATVQSYTGADWTLCVHHMFMLSEAGGRWGIYPQLDLLMLTSFFQFWFKPLVRLLILIPSSWLSVIISARFSYSKAPLSFAVCAQQNPFSLMCFIHSMLFSINTFPLSPPGEFLSTVYINSPFVVPIIFISPAALSSSSVCIPPFQSSLCHVFSVSLLPPFASALL